MIQSEGGDEETGERSTKQHIRIVALTPKSKPVNDTAVIQSAEDLDFTDRSPLLRPVTQLDNIVTIKNEDTGLPNSEVRLSIQNNSKDSNMGGRFQHRNSSQYDIKEVQGTETALIDSRVSIPMNNMPDANHATLETVMPKQKLKIGISLYTHRKEEPEPLNEEHSFEIMKPAKVKMDSPFSAGALPD